MESQLNSMAEVNIHPPNSSKWPFDTTNLSLFERVIDPYKVTLKNLLYIIFDWHRG